ncbi:MAG: RnfABCDGE type electron transport complex subunit D [Candidatus Omnitrophota bacterium]
MDQKQLVVSLAPHSFGSYSVRKMMTGVILALMPAFAVSIYVFGLDAIRVTFLAVASAVCFEYLIQKFILKTKTSVSDGSAAVTGILLAYNVPSHLPWWMIILGSFVAIAIAKMSFGGLGNNPFNPALIGRVFLLISFPMAMTSWPTPLVNRWSMIDAVTSATPLGIVKEGIKNGQQIGHLMTQVPSTMDMFLGRVGGCIGEVSALALLVGFLYLLYKKIITWHIPVSMIGAVAVFSGILWVVNPHKYADPLFAILSGGVFLGAIFMATDYVTSPMSPQGMIIFGVCIGLITVVIRVFGAYPEGVSFAILIMNAFVPIIDRYCKPKRFGE